jgi:pSer/pThr/pTyr-binding forkhead associated (FHA) protein
MPVRLLALAEGPDIVVDRAPTVVGRHPQCDVRLRSNRVSRRHCCLTEVDGDVLVRDLGSSNGTLINGARVDAGRLQAGDVLTVANLHFRLVEDQVASKSKADVAADAREGTISLSSLPGTALGNES